MSEGKNRFIWLHSVPETFGSAKLLSKVRAEERAIQKARATPSEMSDDPTKQFELLMESLGKLMPPQPAYLELRKSVANQLHEGSLEAWGIQVVPLPGREPELVPRHMFSNPAAIKWASNKIKKSGRIYEDIQVRRALVPMPSVTKRPITEKGRNGRPSKESSIVEILHSLFKSPEEANLIPRKEAYGLILDEAKRQNIPTEIGFSKPVLLRCLNREFGNRG